jgi:hypothetical protein
LTTSPRSERCYFPCVFLQSLLGQNANSNPHHVLHGEDRTGRDAMIKSIMKRHVRISQTVIHRKHRSARKREGVRKLTHPKCYVLCVESTMYLLDCNITDSRSALELLGLFSYQYSNCGTILEFNLANERVLRRALNISLTKQ